MTSGGSRDTRLRNAGDLDAPTGIVSGTGRGRGRQTRGVRFTAAGALMSGPPTRSSTPGSPESETPQPLG